MAGLPLNTFKNITKVPVVVGTPSSGSTLGTVYSAPLGVTSIVLMAQVANVGAGEAYVTAVHRKGKAPNNITFIVKDIVVPPNDARLLLGGKLVLESLDSLQIYTNDGTNPLHFISSVLETANQ